MRHRYIIALALLAPACTATSADQTVAAGDTRFQQCFYASQVTGYTNGGQDRIYANISRRATWELTLSPGCSQVDFSLAVGLVSRGTQRICSGADAELLVPRASQTSVQRCLIRTIRKLSREEADAVRSAPPER